jgi:hypothetical protein
VRPRRRNIFIAALLLGLLTNILLAWSFAATQDMFGLPSRWLRLARPLGEHAGPEIIEISQHIHAGAIGWDAAYEVGVAPPPSNDTLPVEVQAWAAPWLKPWESTERNWPQFFPPAPLYAIRANVVRGYGWPLPALACVLYLKEPAGPTFAWGTRGSLVVPWFRSPDSISIRPPLILPYLPLSRGIVVNSALYAVIWAAVLFACRSARTRFRRRRSRCIVCNYDLGALPPGSPCPECGHPSPAGHGSATPC